MTDCSMEQAVGCRVLEAWKSRDLMLLLESEEQFENQFGFSDCSIK